MKRVLDYNMWTVKEEGSKEHDFRLDLVHPMLMVSWIMELARRSIYHATFRYGASVELLAFIMWGPVDGRSFLVMMLENFITSTIWLCQVQWSRKWLK
ncbi:uncharacterized protein LOC126718221 isoform X2 [Quercus robur]|uniref:uncharacterized protein LOC126718221 isoform X2 n=1 Tax=Quercus robur TaxID=38942 RepID=UPI0021615EDC|nr:uncharacterized protein LOC126718221 isoform X2 [Quercus robur]